MGYLKIGDKIIVTEVLSSLVNTTDAIGKPAIILAIDEILPTFPYKILHHGKPVWVEGLLYTPLMEELF